MELSGKICPGDFGAVSRSLRRLAGTLNLMLPVPSRWSPDRGGNFTRTGHVRKLTMGKFNLFLVLGRGYVYEGIRPSDYDGHLSWGKHASHNRKKL